ncbi:hypothetical protein CLOACE_05670 [Clostridium acetireducens DSM 10703]|uniref:Uncharacterized protein n=1 Tax=Clostridium acetireducens DSM 10703 TaxID=1121290 RepID=A0A1E8F0L1_9CLOT|nr:hypothetical protein [Clostridium acetireducens]OFI06981.1 hypothetical protein CLOACE_05670 [Clostridium acetireducens DSM 10703]
MEFINNKFSNWLFILLSILIIVAAVYLFFTLVPLIILLVLSFWIFKKCKSYFKNFSIREKVLKKRSYKSSWTNTKSNKVNKDVDFSENIIDVDYKEV